MMPQSTAHNPNVSAMVCNATVENSDGCIFIDAKAMHWVSLLRVRARPLSFSLTSSNQTIQQEFRHMYEYDHDPETQNINRIKFQVWLEQDLTTQHFLRHGLGSPLSPLQSTLPIGSQIQFVIEGIYNHHHSSDLHRIRLPWSESLHQQRTRVVARSPTTEAPRTQLNPPFQDRAAFLEENLDSSNPDILLMNLRRYQVEARLAAASERSERINIPMTGINLFKQEETDYDEKSESTTEEQEETNHDPNYDCTTTRRSCGAFINRIVLLDR